MEQQMIDELKSYLISGVVSVTFTKKDGSERIMRCTVNEQNIPGELLPKGTGTKVTTEVQKVFDLEAQAWRSFRLDSVKTFQVQA